MADFEERRAEQIAEFKRFSRGMTRTLVERFPVPGTQPGQYDDDDEPPYLRPTKHGDRNRDHRDKPRKLYFDQARGLWMVRNLGRARGTYAFVVLCDAEGDGLILGKHGHEHLAKDRAVEFAGEATFKAGELLFWTNNSGHYLPHPMLSTRAGLPWDKFAPMHERNPKFVAAALTVRSSTGDIARLLGWPVADVEAAYRQLEVHRYGKTWKDETSAS